MRITQAISTTPCSSIADGTVLSSSLIYASMQCIAYYGNLYCYATANLNRPSELMISPRSPKIALSWMDRKNNLKIVWLTSHSFIIRMNYYYYVIIPLYYFFIISLLFLYYFFIIMCSYSFFIFTMICNNSIIIIHMKLLCFIISLFTNYY